MTEFLGYTDGSNRYFGTSDPSVERLRQWPADVPYEVVEASYYGFNIPEHDINGEIYYWFHPHFKLASGGVVIFQGQKTEPLSAEYHDWREFMPIPEDITNGVYANGVRVKMLAPLKDFELSFDDPERETSLQLRSSAIMPAAFRPTGFHFTQAMRNTGTLVLRGRRYQIDGFFTRDRTWGDSRPERVMNIAPITWHVGIINEKLAFHVMAFDSAELNEEISKRYSGLENGKNFRWGYVWKDGRLLGVKGCRKLTKREPDGLTPSSYELEIIDETGARHPITGTAKARYPYSAWPNMRCYWTMTEWRWGAHTGYGDSQEIIYENFVRERSRD